MDDTEMSLGGQGALAIGEESVADLYEKATHLYSSRSAECFEATSRQTGERVLLWLLRYPLVVGSDAPTYFMRRLTQIAQLRASMPKICQYGVDARGMAFGALEYVRGRNPLEQGSAPRVLERIFMELVQVVEPFHRAGIAFGDLCFDSFVLDERGRVMAVCVLGSFESGARQTAMLPPPETLPFISPEQRTVGGGDAAADVYAIGIYGYRLFTGKTVPPEIGSAGQDVVNVLPPPSSVRADLPTWVDDVLGRCLDASPHARFHDASELMVVIQEAIRSGSPPGGQGKWSRRTLMVARPTEQAIRPKALDRRQPQQAQVPSTSVAAARARATRQVTKAVNTFTWTVAVLVGLIGAGLVFYAFERMSASKADDPCSVLSHNEYAPSDLKPLIFDVTAKELPFERREAALQKISENKDPIAFSILIAYTSCKTEDRLGTIAEQLIVERVKAQGDPRAADMLEKWFSEVGSHGISPGQQPEYPLLLRAVDVTRPLESRQQALREAYPRAQATTLRLVGALALDEKEDRFTGVLRDLLRDSQPNVNFEHRGVGALVLSSNVLAVAFSGEMSGLIPRFSDEDLIWVADRLADADSNFVYDVAKELVHRKLAAPFQMVFLRALGEAGKSRLTVPVQRALVHGGLGHVSREDVMQLGRWMSLDAEDTLFASCATVADPAASAEAFDILGSRSLNNEPGSSLMKWVKAHAWDYRAKLAKPIGVLALTDIAADNELDYAFNELMPYAQGSGLFRAIVQSKNEKLIRIALTRLGDITPGDELLELLDNKSRGVRISAVKALKGRNELAILQGILRAYAREQDEEVRTVYRENHWVTQDRDPSKIFNK